MARGKPADVVPILTGMKEEFADAQIVYAQGCGFEEMDEASVKAALEAAENADVICTASANAVISFGEIYTYKLPALKRNWFARLN